MALTKFCCCCDLRRGSIIFAWLEMMSVAVIIALLIGCSDLMTTELTSDGYYYYKVQASGYAIIFKICNAFYFIKGTTCVALIFGVLKKSHLFYQPWLFISGVEISIQSIIVFITFILTFVITPGFLIYCLIVGGLTALHMYFWFCIYTVYKKDMKPSSVTYELQYDELSGAQVTMS